MRSNQLAQVASHGLRHADGRSLHHDAPVDHGLCIRIPAYARTWKGFRAWVTSTDFPDSVRTTFVRGEIYLDMSKEELETHAAVKAEVSRALLNLNRELKIGKYYLDGVLISNAVAQVSTNPDGTLVTRASLRAKRAILVPRLSERGQYIEIEGRPDWVLEVVSDSSVSKDMEKLLVAYHRARIPEYWIIDARGADIVFQILRWRKNGYIAAPVSDGWQRSGVCAREFRLLRQRDELGLWEYTLEM